jgi:hypothetical protein
MIVVVALVTVVTSLLIKRGALRQQRAEGLGTQV